MAVIFTNVFPAIFALVFLSTSCSSYKVLMIPVQQHSHVTSAISIANELDRRGHEVHVLSFDKYFQTEIKSRNKSSKMKLINLISSGEDVEDRIEAWTRKVLDTEASLDEIKDFSDAQHQRRIVKVLMDSEESLLQLKQEKYDIAIVDGWLFSKYYYLIPHRLGIPWITYTVLPEPFLMRTPSLSSFVPHLLSTFTDHMNFIERCINTLQTTLFYFTKPQIDVPRHIADIYQQYGEFESLDDLMTRSKLFLVTADVVLDYSRPLMPNVIEIGGLTTTASKDLPEDIQRFMDESNLGVIVVSFGSMLSKYPNDLVIKFNSAFHKLAGYRVVWRLVNSYNLTLSSNVMTAQWLPQNDVLAHPKTKLFITHCGNNGQFEAIYNKVPMIGFPLFGDQMYNSKRIVHKGYGIAMNIFDFSSDELQSNIEKILSDPSYKTRITRASDIFRSARESPAERAAHWIEHICRFGGDHLRSAGNDLTMYQYLLLDVLVVVCLCCLLVTLVFIKVIIKLFSYILGLKERLRRKYKVQ